MKEEPILPCGMWAFLVFSVLLILGTMLYVITAVPKYGYG